MPLKVPDKRFSNNETQEATRDGSFFVFRVFNKSVLKTKILIQNPG
ncbi:hypothetical protein A33Q_4350 [Indibacter alkaliphilus LW1]|uniref:Uncharacterized protein n=1 Tax=Indibacter alkaliphilus (strain CCUG 57479 / KCTC 22604 / LW1) TaxID=1189612 RepID=S2CYL6_INDAL|nr:hypothetical protein A33Q_4350 [Indibacter alkaliphilus LW1]